MEEGVNDTDDSSTLPPPGGQVEVAEVRRSQPARTRAVDPYRICLFCPQRRNQTNRKPFARGSIHGNVLLRVSRLEPFGAPAPVS